MTRRITRKLLMKKLELIANELNRSVGFKKGEINLDYYAIGGGYKLVEYGENGGEFPFFLNERVSAKEMANLLDVVLGLIPRIDAAVEKLYGNRV